MTPQRPPEEAYDAILRLGGVAVLGGAAVLATSAAVTAVRHRLDPSRSGGAGPAGLAGPHTPRHPKP
ncbi:hypothetical protein OTB20_11495 [Streptomyces sp. H27-H1]|uniref:hypothetical protein n=1 Tax=Streptomyces sp. H27-H1 TaxID=2996461 RepID=UPI00227211B9|nr:hypothetical protein [Streptomyces sp. H27-H1]MCY0926815.1 hypothetical protein [Streptomyces sp. H27-H1]